APDADANRISGHNAPFFVLSSYHAIRNGYVRRKVPGRINAFDPLLFSLNPQTSRVHIIAFISAPRRNSIFLLRNPLNAVVTRVHAPIGRIELCTYINQRV
ncbi:MAG: hypothetical protein KDK34_08660, partial [Leptospiraceae bacterium]|nr:hypothetical protein [Leptospiraceae bacterium]